MNQELPPLKDRIINVLDKYKTFTVHRYKYSLDRHRKILRQLAKSGYIKFDRATREELVYVLVDRKE